jgi:hypothetical protein
MIQMLCTGEEMEEKYQVLQEIGEYDVCDDEQTVLTGVGGNKRQAGTGPTGWERTKGRI